MNKKPYRKVEQQIIDSIENFERAEDKIASTSIEEITNLSSEKTNIEPLGTVQVIHPSLRRRNAPNYDAEVVGLIQDQGIYNIYEVKDIWGKLEDNTWISLEFTKNLKKEI